MRREHTPPPLTASRMFPIAAATAILAAALMALLAPTVTAAPVAPYFSPTVQVDQPPGFQGSQPSLAVGIDGAVYVSFSAWSNAVTGTDVFFTKSANGGRTWTVPVRVNDDAGGASQTESSLALDARNEIFIVWTDTRRGTNDVYFSKSTDGGRSFSTNVYVNDVAPQAQQEPDIAVDSAANPVLVHVVWTDYRNLGTTGPDIYYANSTDGGLSFNPNVRLNTDAGAAEQGSPAIAVASDRSVDVVWRDSRVPAQGADIYFTKSTDRGFTWVPATSVNHDVGNVPQTEPSIAVNETGAIFVAWTDYRNGINDADIYATRSTNGGSSFVAENRVNDDPSQVQQIQPSIAAAAGKVQVAWSDYRTGGFWPYAIYTASSEDGLAWSANVKINGNTGRELQTTPSTGIDASGDVIVAWFDQSFLGQSILAATLDVVAPTSVAGPAMMIDQGAAVPFDAGGSTDNFGIASYYWDFHDGTGAASASSTHTYAIPGVYTATLTVWDFSGNAASSSLTVTVRDTEAPVPRGGGDRSVDEGQSLFFDGSASTDNVGVTGYAWSFGDNTSATTATASHAYARPGTYAASLTVTDAAGNAATSTFTVTVRGVSPKASDLLGMIEILEGIVAILAAALAFVGWLLFGMRKREQRPPEPKSARPPTQRPDPMPPLPQTPPPREPDPLDMTLPPGPPSGP